MFDILVQLVLALTPAYAKKLFPLPVSVRGMKVLYGFIECFFPLASVKAWSRTGDLRPKKTSSELGR